MMYLYVLKGNNIREAANQFQHSSSTMSKYIHEVADIFDSVGHLLILHLEVLNF